MKKLLEMSLVPVVLAAMPLMAFSETTLSQDNHVGTTPNHHTMNPAIIGQHFVGATMNDVETLKNFTQGQWQLVDKNYPEAIKSFEAVLKTEPNFVRALNGLALAYYNNGDFNNALEPINRAISLDPVNTKLYLTKARILDGMDKDTEALESYLTFAALDPTDSSAIQAQRRADEIFTRWEGRFTEPQKNFYTGLRFLSMEQPGNAIPLLEKFITAEPADVNGRFLLGMAYRMNNQPTQAIPQFEAITKNSPSNPVAYYHLGMVYNMAGKKQNAQDAWKNFVKFAPHADEVGLVNYHLQNMNGTVKTTH